MAKELQGGVIVQPVACIPQTPGIFPQCQTTPCMAVVLGTQPGLWRNTVTGTTDGVSLRKYFKFITEK